MPTDASAHDPPAHEGRQRAAGRPEDRDGAAPTPGGTAPRAGRAPRSGRGWRPPQQVRAEVLAAAGHLLLAEGMGAFTIERVAALSGASKMTIYKGWPSRGVLALEGYASTVDSVLAVPDTGDVEADLTTQLLTYVHLLRETPAGRVTAELLGAAQTDPQLAAAFHRAYSAPRRAAGLAALRTAQERGQVRADAEPEVVIDQLWGACLYRLLLREQPLTDDFARGLVQNLLDGIRAG